MKRGNTALKRVVSVASVAAMAIAGAVLAAPAASAAPIPGDAVRAQPIADAIYINSTTGALQTKASATDNAFATTSTGAAPLVKAGATGQVASSVQIAVPVANDATTITLTLAGGVTFRGTPNARITPKPVSATDLNNVAGYVSGATASAATTDTTATALTSAEQNLAPTVNGTKDALNLTLNGGFNGTGVYLITVENIRVDVPAGFSSNAGGPVSVAVTDDATASAITGATTIAFVAPFEVTVPSGSATTSGASTLPDVTLSELRPAAFTAAPTTYKLVLTTDPVGTTAASFDVTEATVKTNSSSGLTITDANAGADGTQVSVTGGNTVEIPVTAAANTFANDSITVTGLKVKNVPAGSKVFLTLDTSANTQYAPTEGAVGGDFANTHALVAPAAEISTTAPNARLAGNSRYQTAWKIALDYEAAATSAVTSVVVANGETYKSGVDALSANYLAGQENAPILLTEAKTLPAATQSALIGLFAGTSGEITVYVMGKTDSVSQAVRDQIVAALNTAGHAKVTLKEVQGENRYETSAAAATTGEADGTIGTYSLKVGDAYLKTAFLASGKVNADALAAGSVSASANIPVLLADGDAADKTVTDAIKSLGIQQIIVLGGPDRISDKLVDSLKDAGVTSTKRIAGTDRYNTAAELYTFAQAPVNPAKGTDRGLGQAALSTQGTTAYLANGTDGFPDALSVGPLASLGQNAVLTVQQDKLGAEAVSFLKDRAENGSLAEIVALGQSDRIADSVIKAAQDAIAQ